MYACMFVSRQTRIAQLAKLKRESKQPFANPPVCSSFLHLGIWVRMASSECTHFPFKELSFSSCVGFTESKLDHSEI